MKPARALWFSLSAVIGALVVPACDRILGVDGDYALAPDGGAGAAAGSGGAASSTSTAAGGGGGEPKDCDPDDPGPFDEGQVCPRDMVDTGTFCIDAQEADFVDYLGVVDRHARSCFGDNSLDSGTCEGNEPFNIAEDAFRAAKPDNPAHPIDYCDAENYCRLRGRTLCTYDEWRSACSADMATWPYGNSEADGQCIDYPFLEPANRRGNTCHRQDGLSEIVDMAGNAAEYILDCNDAGCGPCQDTGGCIVAGAQVSFVEGAVDICNTRTGGPYRKGFGGPPMTDDLRTGVRCCYHPER